MANISTRLFVFIIIAACLALFCPFSAFCDDAPQGISNFRKVDEGFYRGAYPDEEGLAYLKKTGVKTIIDLRAGKASVSRERRAAEALGIKYINIPFGFMYKPPEDEEVKKFLIIVTDQLNRPLFVHCQSGNDRTGAMVALYRIAVSGWQVENAYSEAKDSGFHPICWLLRKFILEKAEGFKNYDKKQN